MPYSAIIRAELNQDGTINLIANIDGFTVGEPVDLSGEAIQGNGAVVTFNSVQQMPQNGLIVVPRLAAVPPNQFKAGASITVVARAAQVWVTTLVNDPDPGSAQRNWVAGQSKGAWKPDQGGVQWAVVAQESDAEKPDAEEPDAEEPETPLMRPMRHGTWWDGVKREPLDTTMQGRFTRLFPYLPAARFDHAALVELARAMTARPQNPVPAPGSDPEENQTIPAIYTYLGQFADHDITFDPTSSLRERLTKAQLEALVDFRTPRFDLDNLYGRGPDDQPYMYDSDGVHMLLGDDMSGDPLDPQAKQVPRGPNNRALTGDPRDDENRIISQLHTMFLRFHNVIADRYSRDVSFAEVRDQVRWHYQWILVTDFLPTIMEEPTYKSVFPDPHSRVPMIPRLRERDLELMPVEFSVAAYRFGHSMIRPRYRLNANIEAPIFSADPSTTPDLGGMRPIPSDWAIDWRYFVDLGPDAGPAAPDQPQLSYKIDTSLVNPLGDLPPQIATAPKNLALRDLERAVTFGLPSGQRVAEALGLPVIPDKDLLIGKAVTGSPNKPITKVAPGFEGNAPLWVYILAEARVASWQNPPPGLARNLIPLRLGPLGGRLVAEVFASLLRGDPTSYVNAERRFEPIPDLTRHGTFGIAQLINAVLGRSP
jgi:hypothetical protein